MSYPPGFDDWPLQQRNEYFANEAKKYREQQNPAPPGANGNGHAKRSPAVAMATLIRASTITPEPISWLWKDWLACGKLHIIAGQSGVGKSTIAMKLAAIISAGGRWPDGTRAPHGNVIIWSGEDDPKDTLVPRLEASGADLTRIYFVGSMKDEKGGRPFDPARDMEALLAVIKAVGGAALIIVDPIVSAVPGDSHKNAETRRGLQPLVDIAAELNAALVGITHFTKGTEGKTPIERVTGSVAFGAFARIVMVAAKRQDGAGRLFARAASNLSPDDGGFAYELQQTPMYSRPDITASVVAWGEAITGSAREMLAEAEAVKDDDGDGGALREAKDFLLDLLMDGPLGAKECRAQASDAALSWRTVERAKTDLNVASVKRDGSWFWVLPQDRQPSGKVANPKNLGGLGGLGGLQENQGVTEGQDRQINQDRQHFGGEHLDASDAEFQAQLKALREANAQVYADPKPWRQR